MQSLHHHKLLHHIDMVTMLVVQHQDRYRQVLLAAERMRERGERFVDGFDQQDAEFQAVLVRRVFVVLFRWCIFVRSVDWVSSILHCCIETSRTFASAPQNDRSK